MNELILIDEIIKALETELANIQLQTQSQSTEVGPPRVFDGFLPAKRSGQGEDYPFVIVRPADGQTSARDESTVQIKFIIGTFDDDAQNMNGYRDCMIIMGTIRRFFMERPIFAKNFMFQRQFQWRVFEEQPYPYWMMECTAGWNVATAQIEPDEGVL